MDLRGKRLVVIGGAGFIGSHTVDHLLREDVREIIVYDDFSRGSLGNLKSALADPRVRIFEAGGDICRIDLLHAALRGVDGVFHFAALWLLQCEEYPRAAFEVNVAGTFNVLEACVANGVRRLVYSSSASVYGDGESGAISEDHPLNNERFYGATKIAGEAMCRAFHHRYGLGYLGLRYMNVYGPRQDHRGAYAGVVMKMLNALRAGQQPRVAGDGSQALDFVYVGDCAEANVCAMRSDTVDRFYNVGTGTSITVRELAEKLLHATGQQCGIRYDSTIPSLVRNRVADPTAARRDLGFSAAVSVDDGLRRTIEWARECGLAPECPADPRAS